MDLKLIPGEQILRQYDYGHTLVKKNIASKDTTKKTLYVTDKRLVHVADGKGHTDRQDVPLKEIRGVDTGYLVRANMFALILALILGVFFLIFFAAVVKVAVVGVILLLVCAAIGFIIYWKSRVATLQCVISTAAIDRELINTSTFDSKIGRKGGSAKRIKIAVNKGEAEAMVYELAALIFEQAGL